jgi:hypothetical protein
VTGYSGDTARLVKLIESSPSFKNPRFRAPVVGGTDRKGDRFDLSFELEEGPAP